MAEVSLSSRLLESSGHLFNSLSLMMLNQLASHCSSNNNETHANRSLKPATLPLLLIIIFMQRPSFAVSLCFKVYLHSECSS